LVLPAVYDGDMAKVGEVVVEDEIKVQRTGTPLSPVLEEADRVRQKRAFETLRALRGKIHLDIAIDELRGRNR
jgi:hypothetical protein